MFDDKEGEMSQSKHMIERRHVFKHLRRRDPRRPSLRGRRPRRSAMANERHGDRGRYVSMVHIWGRSEISMIL